MTGAGNDFVLIDNQDGIYNLSWSNLAPPLCNRHFGVGADGILIVEKGKKTKFQMLYYNADGSYGGMCGNGGRCFASYLMKQNGQSQISFEALDYIYDARMIDNQVSLRMKSPISFRDNIKVEINSDILHGYYIDTGAPHTVFVVDDQDVAVKKLLTSSIVPLGRAIRYHDAFKPNGTNVDFISRIGENAISMRTYERGVEDETLACGTGACASAIVSSKVLGLKPPIRIKTQGGEELEVNFTTQGEHIENVTLTGSVKELFSGTIVIDKETYLIVNSNGT